MEVQRDQYLQAMGIQVWHARMSLPGAKPAPTIAIKSLADEPVEQSSYEEVDDVTDQLAHSINAGQNLSASHTNEEKLSADNSDVSTIVEADSPADISIEPQPAAQKTALPRFRLGSIVFPDVCVVIVQLPLESGYSITDKHLHLLQELLRAMGVTTSAQPELTYFSWPMLRGAHFDQGPLAACEASKAFLRGQKAKHGPQFVLLMGQTAGQYLLSEDASLKHAKGRLLESTEQPMLLTESLDHILAEPLLKGGVWVDLQPLVKWLNQGL